MDQTTSFCVFFDVPETDLAVTYLARRLEDFKWKTEKGRVNGERQGLLGSSPGKPNQSTH